MTDCPAGICDGRNCEHIVVVFGDDDYGPHNYDPSGRYVGNIYDHRADRRRKVANTALSGRPADSEGKE